MMHASWIAVWSSDWGSKVFLCMLVTCSSWVTDCCKSQSIKGTWEKEDLPIVYPSRLPPPTPCQIDGFFFSLSPWEVLKGWDAWELRISPESSELIIRRFKASWMDRSADATFNCFFPPGACRFRRKTGFLAQRMSMGESYFFFSFGKGKGDGVDCVCRCCIFFPWQFVEPPVSDLGKCEPKCWWSPVYSVCN